MSHNPRMTSTSPDAELMALIDRVGRRDEAALRQLYDRTSPKLFGLAMRVVRQREWAEDVLQEAFLTIWRVAGDYRASLSPPMAWLGLIVRSRALDLLRRRTADRAQLTQEFDEVMAETFESDASNPMDTADASEQASREDRSMNLVAHPQLLELLAASHALGTLRGGARRRFEALAREQAPIRAAALVWQGRLASMAELQAPVVPDAAVWTRIRNLIQAEQDEQSMARQRATPAGVAAPSPGGWLRSLALWRGATAAGALATVLAVTVGLNLRDQLVNAPAVQYVAVLSDDQQAASMLVTFDPKKQQLVLQRVGNFAEGADKSLQLWALPPGGAPRSLGVIDKAAAVRLAAAESAVRAVPTLAISLEPRGGVPSEGGPTGPVLFKGALIEKTL
ncbi:MAG: hypothetical protein EOP81_17190 [Variovorax sp.]|nr:MAG: hypothetical protein EOP81_17190 [Variovorax sp.]